MLDYLVVGLGLSGLAVSSQLEKQQKSFRVFEDFSEKSSLVAGGIFNPVILKRFKLAWKADEQLEKAIPFYQQLENELGEKVLYPWNIYRKFHSAEEQNNWFEAADKPLLSPFFDTRLEKQLNACIEGDYSFGRVRNTGNIDTDILLKNYAARLKQKDQISFERFDYDALKIYSDSVEYKGISARQIIFCEGWGMRHNPYFNYLPLRGNKGEYLIIYSEELKLDKPLKSSFFILPLGNDLYKVGATYEHKDLEPVPTENARKQLTEFLDETLKCSYEVVDQVAAVRPATADRRPLVGRHPEYSSLYCCNGYGSRGVLIAPTAAEELLKFIEEEKPLSEEMDIKRFTRKHYKKSQ